jgi:hypothetical protein
MGGRPKAGRPRRRPRRRGLRPFRMRGMGDQLEQPLAGEEELCIDAHGSFGIAAADRLINCATHTCCRVGGNSRPARNGNANRTPQDWYVRHNNALDGRPAFRCGAFPAGSMPGPTSGKNRAFVQAKNVTFVRRAVASRRPSYKWQANPKEVRCTHSRPRATEQGGRR